MSESPILIESDERGVARLTLNRPELHNAFDDRLIAELTAAIDALVADDAVRLVVLQSSGKSFSAGADLNWMRRVADYSEEENRFDAMQLARLMRNLNESTKPVIGRVQGPVFGGGLGLVACCDIVVASEAALFCLSEVRLGLIPAVISPFVVEAIGAQAARRYFLTAERFSALKALELGLVHEVVDNDKLDATVDSLIDQMLLAGPCALSEAKQLIYAVAASSHPERMMRYTSDRIARLRSSDEGREGLNAFLEKRKPAWVQEGQS